MDIENPLCMNNNINNNNINNNNINNNQIAIPVAQVVSLEVVSVDVYDEELHEPQIKNIYTRCYLYMNIAALMIIWMSLIMGMLSFIIWLNDSSIFD